MEDHRRSSSSSSHSHDLFHILGFVSFCKACKSLISKCYTNNNSSPSFKENKIRTNTKRDGEHRIKLKSQNPKSQIIQDHSPSCDNSTPQWNPISTRTNRLSRTMSHDSRSSPRRDQQHQPFSGPPTKTMKRRNSLNDLKSTSSGVLPRTLSRCGSTRMGYSQPIVFSNSHGLMKPPPLEMELDCTLEELCFGCIKKIEITRDVVSDNGETVEEDETLTIKVKPGWQKGTKITFEGVGNKTKGVEPGDVIVVVTEKPHHLFKRLGDDLELRLDITLVDALTACGFRVPLLGGHVMNLTIDDVIEPGHEMIIEGQGMPRLDEPGKRGDLKIIFDVRFPRELTEEQRHDVVSILQQSCK